MFCIALEFGFDMCYPVSDWVQPGKQSTIACKAQRCCRLSVQNSVACFLQEYQSRETLEMQKNNLLL